MKGALRNNKFYQVVVVLVAPFLLLYLTGGLDCTTRLFGPYTVMQGIQVTSPVLLYPLILLGIALVLLGIRKLLFPAVHRVDTEGIDHELNILSKDAWTLGGLITLFVAYPLLGITLITFC